ncbi:MAG: polymer-forming cytoskeletal protein [Chitinophagales bacterium]|nr:polymer-forming cytoskeletal protein [Chitinophagales bacterium]MCB9020899.1 polymer-forming cytoskeletal protein [Chitinophagales bacterium]MCB9031894.1 polymer-forming cytoskeletal protein [Chitinophagales bacterium]HAE14265.1 cell shape determination protein CcmA [Bacteroidota bacterium]HAE35186.1 cell shape determination protein CcmA [Bacteroidota bacterium]
MLVSNRINHGTELTGELVSDGDIRVEGVIRGTIKCKAKVAIGPSGLVEGDIFCKSADVEGRVKGDVEVADTLILKATSSVDGNIQTGKIVVESGARFNGICNMGQREKKVHVEKPVARTLQTEAVS